MTRQKFCAASGAMAGYGRGKCRSTLLARRPRATDAGIPWFVCITRSRDVPVNCGDPVRQSGGSAYKRRRGLEREFHISARMLRMHPPRKIGTPQGIADNGRARASDRQAATRSNHCLAHFRHNDNRGAMIYAQSVANTRRARLCDTMHLCPACQNHYFSSPIVAIFSRKKQLFS